MKAEEARQLADQSLTALSQALAAGKSEALTAFLAAVGKFHAAREQALPAALLSKFALLQSQRSGPYIKRVASTSPPRWRH